jgi:hypothetical protein
MNQADPFYTFSIVARSFLARAEEHLVKFERDGSVESLFYAALELRFGIEARLNEYLKPALTLIGRDSKSIVEYVGTKLLKHLMLTDPHAGQPKALRLTGETNGQSVTMQFTPVTPRLASIHGQLGELLHYAFFTKK